MTCVVALDVGGTSMKGAVVSRSYDLLVAERRPTGRSRGPSAVVAAILDFAAHLVARAPAPVAAVGVAVPGIVDDASGTAVYSANLAWRDVPMRRLLADRLGLPVVVAHDVRTGGVAEATLGAGRGVDDFLFLPIGTGVSAALMLSGRPYPGPTGAVGELGHIIVRPGGLPCACGQQGCLEAYASAAALSRRYSPPPATPGTADTPPTQTAADTPAQTAPTASAPTSDAAQKTTSTQTVPTEGVRTGGAEQEAVPTQALPTESAQTSDAARGVSAEEVVRRAVGGEAAAVRVWEDALDALADGLHAATMVIDPSLIVVGGGLAESGDLLLGPLAERLAARFTFREAPRLTQAELGDRAAMLGAAVLAWQAAER